MTHLNLRTDDCGLDFLSIGSLVHRLDPGVIPFRRARSFEIHVSGGEYNVAVNVISPGSLRTEGSAAIPWTQRDWHERVEPSEVGPSAVYLAKQDAKSMTGRLVMRAEFGKTWGI